jgi:hypothetical protein
MEEPTSEQKGKGASTEASTSTSTSTSASAQVLSDVGPALITRAENEIESMVQLALTELDPWNLVKPIYQINRMTEEQIAKTCTKERHICDLDSGRVCVGCALYRQLVKTHSVFGSNSASDMRDIIAMIYGAMSTQFIKNGRWLTALDKSPDTWFVSFPLVIQRTQHFSLVAGPFITVKRNRVRLYEAGALLARLGLSAYKDTIYRKLPERWNTSAGGVVYCLNDLLDELAPISAPVEGLTRLGIQVRAREPVTDSTSGSSMDIGASPLAILSVKVGELLAELRE